MIAVMVDIMEGTNTGDDATDLFKGKNGEYLNPEDPKVGRMWAKRGRELRKLRARAGQGKTNEGTDPAGAEKKQD